MRKFYKTWDHPPSPFMVAGGWILKNIGPHFPYQVCPFRPLHLPPAAGEVPGLPGLLQEHHQPRPGARPGSPHAITMAVTPKCNARRVHFSAYGRNTSEPLTTEQWCFVIDQCAAMGMTDLIITGGEPLLHPEPRCAGQAHRGQRLRGGPLSPTVPSSPKRTSRCSRRLGATPCSSAWTALRRGARPPARRARPLHDTVTEGIQAGRAWAWVSGPLSTYMGRAAAQGTITTTTWSWPMNRAFTSSPSSTWYSLAYSS